MQERGRTGPPLPRDFVAEGSFGRLPAKGKALTWTQPTSVSQLFGLRAAEIQHAFASELRSRLGARQHEYEDAAAETRLTVRRIGDILNGSVHMKLQEAAALEAVYGPILLGLEIDYTVVEDVKLREAFPHAVGMAPLVNRHDPRPR